MRALFLLSVSAVLVGCGRSDPPLTTVTGTVHYRGAPIQSGTIVFVPDESRGCSGPIAQGKINADGSFRLWTDGRPGVISGWHRVTIASPLARSASETVLPIHYGDPDLSGQELEVKAGRDNQVTFDLQ